MKSLIVGALAFLCGVAAAGAAERAGTAERASSILFVGNSFTYGHGSAVREYRADTVTDLNGSQAGGVAALFKLFTVEAGLAYDVSVETHPGVGLDWHLDHELALIVKQPWDHVVLQSHSLLDVNKPGDPAELVRSVRTFASALVAVNPAVDLRLTATWSRADQTYLVGGAWYGKPIEAMAREVRAGYDLAAAGTPAVKAVVGVGDAWLRAIHTGVADANPYDGIDAGKIDLWTSDHYHASSFGYYLEALMLFGSVTGLNPQSLGASECAGFELSMSTAQVAALEQVAAQQLTADGAVFAAPPAGETAVSVRHRAAPAAHSALVEHCPNGK